MSAQALAPHARVAGQCIQYCHVPASGQNQPEEALLQLRLLSCCEAEQHGAALTL